MVKPHTLLALGSMLVLGSTGQDLTIENSCEVYVQTFRILEGSKCNPAPGNGVVARRARRKGMGMGMAESSGGNGKEMGMNKANGGKGKNIEGARGSSAKDTNSDSGTSGGETTCSVVDEFMAYWGRLALNSVPISTLVASSTLESNYLNDGDKYIDTWEHELSVEYNLPVTGLTDLVTPSYLNAFATSLPTELIFSLCGCTDTIQLEYAFSAVRTKKFQENGDPCVPPSENVPPIASGLHSEAATEAHSATTGSIVTVGVVGLVCVVVGVAVIVRRSAARAGYEDAGERAALVAAPTVTVE